MAVHDPLELLVRAAEAVDVVAEMDVRVDDLRAGGKLLPKLLVVRGDQLLAAFERVVHEGSVYAHAGRRPPLCPTS